MYIWQKSKENNTIFLWSHDVVPAMGRIEEFTFCCWRNFWSGIMCFHMQFWQLNDLFLFCITLLHRLLLFLKISLICDHQFMQCFSLILELYDWWSNILNVDAAFDSYIYNRWLELPGEDRYILYRQCPVHIFSVLEGLCLNCETSFPSFIVLSPIRPSKTMTEIWKCLTFNCMQVVKPLLQERTRRKIQVLQGCGRDELLKVSMFSFRRALASSLALVIPVVDFTWRLVLVLVNLTGKLVCR